jgi:hypothetical protein
LRHPSKGDCHDHAKFANHKLAGSEKSSLNQRFEAIGWALFLIMLGGIGLVPEGTWLVGVGLIMLGLNLARYLSDIPMSLGTLFLGSLA